MPSVVISVTFLCSKCGKPDSKQGGIDLDNPGDEGAVLSAIRENTQCSKCGTPVDDKTHLLDVHVSPPTF
jgi:hypothetical protein